MQSTLRHGSKLEICFYSNGDQRESTDKPLTSSNNLKNREILVKKEKRKIKVIYASYLLVKTPAYPWKSV